jgi:sugar lactone lactonase YvrE
MEVAARLGATLGEGPRWDAAGRRLLAVDIEGRTLHRIDPATGEDRPLELGQRIGVAVPVEGGGLLLALARLLAVLDEAANRMDPVAALPHGDDVRTNDGACDPAGRFFVGTMALDERPGGGALYRYSAAAGLELVLADVTLSNGIGWSPDGGRMYYVDSPTHRVDVFDYDAATGEPDGRRPFATVAPEDGTPDGLAVDGEGGVWVALYGGGAVRRYDADGRLDRIVQVPATNVTSCCFGGDDGRSLFVTTARQGLSPAQLEREPDAGSVFVTRIDVAGPPARPFAHAGGTRSTAPSEADETSAR